MNAGPFRYILICDGNLRPSSLGLRLDLSSSSIIVLGRMCTSFSLSNGRLLVPQLHRTMAIILLSSYLAKILTYYMRSARLIAARSLRPGGVGVLTSLLHMYNLCMCVRGSISSLFLPSYMC